MNFRSLAAAGVIAGALFGATSASASGPTLYQSFANLATDPANHWCSTCGFISPDNGQGQYIGQAFNLASGGVANTATFGITAGYDGGPITVDIFSGNTGTLGGNVFHHTFSSSSYLSNIAGGTNVRLITVGLGNVALGAGDYSIWFSNPVDLGVAAYLNQGGGQIAMVGSPNDGPLSGDGYFQISGNAYSSAVQINGVPEPISWALMIGGFAMAGGMLRRHRALAA